MNDWQLWVWALLCALVAAGVILWDRRRTKRTMDRIEHMLKCAVDGSFSEQSFDESRMSALETKFAHYFSAAAVSAGNVAAEKDKIKTLIADISHQTKTPISNLLLYTELLEEEALPEEVRGTVEALHAQTEKLHFLIDALVKLSRLENGILTLVPRREPLQPMLRGVLEQFAAKAEGKGLALRLEDTEACAVFDPKWTAEALGNLVDNAVKYTGRGEIVLSVCAYEMFVRIDVADTGIGIPEEEQAKIFSRFYRSEEARDKEGVGLGLYLAREILSAEDGYMKVASVRGQGTVFSVFLPR